MKVLKLFGGAIVSAVVFLVLIWALLLLGRFVSCGPNSTDVKVMKPMAQKISEYIIKNGIPESLKDIPDLPYELVGCENVESYRKGDNRGGWEQIKNKKDAENITKKKSCIFNHKRKIKIIITNQIYTLNQEEYAYLKLENNISKTIANIDFIKINDNFKIEESLKFMDFKSSGICTSLRQ